MMGAEVNMAKGDNDRQGSQAQARGAATQEGGSGVARVIEISARSNRSFEEAIQIGITRVNKTMRNVTSAWVKEQRIEIKNGKPVSFQVNLLITFVLEE
jgi:flavin-binding protein dodecin